jgi:hypothetical protein
MMDFDKEVFLCHASEDKEGIVRPLGNALSHAGINVWVDEHEIVWGESILGKVNEGLSISKFVMVIMTESFLQKNYPKKEMEIALNYEMSTGINRVLPLLVGNQATRARILQEYPVISGKMYVVWDGNPQKIVGEFQKVLGKKGQPKPSIQTSPSKRSIPMPKIQKKFTQFEKDKFAREALAEIQAYFREGLHELERAHPDFKTDLMEYNFKFVCTVYYQGEVKNRCKIWLGSMTGGSMDTISYMDGQHLDINHDNGSRGWITVTSEGTEMRLSPNLFGLYGSNRDKTLNPTEAAELFWKEFTDRL